MTSYREALGKLGWSLWSARLGDKQPQSGGPGELTNNGAYAYYVQDGKRPLILTLSHEKEKLRVEIKPSDERAEARASRTSSQPKDAPRVSVAAVEPERKAPPQRRPAPRQPSAVDNQIAAAINSVEQTLRQELANVGKPAPVAPPAAAGSSEMPRLRADNTVPIPLPETATEIDYQAGDGKIDFDSQSSVSALAAFYRAEMKKRGWREHRSVINRSNMVVLDFSKSKDKLNLTIMTFGNHAKVSGRGSVLIAQAPKEPAATQQAAAEKPSAKGPPLPLPADATEVTYDKENGRLEFRSATGVKALTDFYKAEMKRLGWKESAPAFGNHLISMLHYAKDDDGLELTINASGDTTNVDASGSFLKSAAAKTARPSADDLKVEESAGLPVPKAHELAEGEKSPMRRALKASVRLTLATTLDFYRRELGKRQWQENKGAVIAGDHALLAFASPEGPAVLKLGRKAGHTTVDLAVKNPAQAAKMGLMPKPGQAKVMIGNMLKVPASITINKKTIKVGPEVGAKKPNGPSLDLPPGKYKVGVALFRANRRRARMWNLPPTKPGA